MSSYLTLERGTPVVDRFGAPVGEVDRVLTLSGSYFDGLIVRTRSGRRFVDAPEVRCVHPDRVELTITCEDCEAPGLTTVDGVPEARWDRTELDDLDVREAIDALKRAYVADRLTADQLADRFEAAYQANSLDDLQRLIPDDD